jgi:hypothetical protein
LRMALVALGSARCPWLHPEAKNRFQRRVMFATQVRGVCQNPMPKAQNETRK